MVVCRFEMNAISVRLGKVVPQTLVKTYHAVPVTQWKHVCIEGMQSYTDALVAWSYSGRVTISQGEGTFWGFSAPFLSLPSCCHYYHLTLSPLA